MDDYLRKARHSIERAQVSPVEEEAMVNAQLAIACAQVAQAELLATQTELLAALIERLDALPEFDGGKAPFVTLTET